MAGYYTVKQGDYVAALASQFGLASYKSIWDHPNNAQLKSQRKKPNILFPGDSIFIPDRQTREEARPTEVRHKFVGKKTELRLRLTLEDQLEKPIANAACVLQLEGETRRVTSDVDGKIDEPIPPTVHKVTLLIQDHQTALNDIQIPILVGNLDPLEEQSGQLARLNNLGYFAGEVGKDDDPAFRSAVEEFQCDFGLLVDGDCGPNTQAKLKKVHGC